MTFNSLHFLLFLPIVIILYYVIPHKFRWLVLLIASYYAYMSYNPWLIFLILATTIVSYLAGLFIPKIKNQAGKKALLWVTIIVCLGILIFFKYFNFLLGSAISFLNLFSMNIKSVAFDIILPVGISFYTFQTLSYVIDVYREKFEPEKHFGYFALYVSFFPQLVAGPIERPEKLIPQLREHHKLDANNLLAGLQLLLVGFFRKVVVADFCGVFVNNVFSDITSANTLAILVAGALFMVQLYCDFAGYSEIALGAAKMMGIDLTQNFDRPFTATTVQRLMRRWHITLTSWFTDYVYIPLGGNRKGKVRQVLNVLVVYLLCGLWHGANWTFVLWGLYMWLFMFIEGLIKEPVRNFAKKRNIDYHKPWIDVIRRIMVFMIAVFSTFFFRAESLSHIGVIYKQLFTSFGFGLDYFKASLTTLGMNALDILEIALILVIMLKLYDFAYDRSFIKQADDNRKMFYRSVTIISSIVVIALGWFILISNDSSSAFVYFQF